MYNGIGLQTARGSGTNGYVQSNRFFVKPRLSKVITDSSLKGFGSGEGTAGLTRKPNREILEHDRKRQIQLKLLMLEETLTDQGYTDREVEEKVEERRRDLQAEAEAEGLEDGEVGPSQLTHTKISDTQTHQIAARKEKQMETLRAALGIGAESQNKRYAMVLSDSEDINNDDEPANNHKKDGNSKKSLKGVVDNTSDLRNVKKSYGNESVEDIHHDSTGHKKQKSGRGHRDDSSDSDDSKEKVVKKDKKKLRRKTTSSDSDEDSDVKRKKKTSQKSRSRRRKDDSESSDSGSASDSGSESDSSSDSGSRKHAGSLKKIDAHEDNSKYHKRDVKESTKMPRRPSISSESDQSDYVKKKKISSKKSGHSRRHDSDSSSSESDSKSDTKSSSDSGSDDELEMKSHQASHRRSERDLNDRRRTGKEHARINDEKSQHDKDSDGLDTLRKLEKLYQPKEEKIVKPDRVSKRKTDDGNWDEQPDRKSRRRDTSDLEYNDEVKHSLGSKDRSENRITDRWGAEPSRDYGVARRETGEDRERQGRKHRRDEEEDTHRINNRDAEQQQPERNRRDQDDHKSSKYDRDRDRDSAKRARYDDSRSSGRRYDEDDDRHGRKYSDGRHDDRRSRR